MEENDRNPSKHSFKELSQAQRDKFSLAKSFRGIKYQSIRKKDEVILIWQDRNPFNSFWGLFLNYKGYLMIEENSFDTLMAEKIRTSHYWLDRTAQGYTLVVLRSFHTRLIKQLKDYPTLHKAVD